MTSEHILSRSDVPSLTTVQRVSGVVVGATLLFGLFGMMSLVTVVFVSALALGLATLRWRGEWMGDLLVRAVRYYSRSRFSSVEHAIVDGSVQLTCRGRRTASLWRSGHHGRLDLRGDEQTEWRKVLQRVEESTKRGESTHFSFHVHGYDTWLATTSLTLPAPWENASAQFCVNAPRWIYESWNDVQSDVAYFRVFEVRDFRHGRDNVIDSLSDSRERWSLHAHFSAESHRDAIRRSRRDRHAADAAMAWRGLRGVVSPVTLADLRVTRQHHESAVAHGAALIDFQMSIVVRASSLSELNEFTSALRDVATRTGIMLRLATGEQGPALAASWPGLSSW